MKCPRTRAYQSLPFGTPPFFLVGQGWSSLSSLLFSLWAIAFIEIRLLICGSTFLGMEVCTTTPSCCASGRDVESEVIVALLEHQGERIQTVVISKYHAPVISQKTFKRNLHFQAPPPLDGIEHTPKLERIFQLAFR